MNKKFKLNFLCVRKTGSKFDKISFHKKGLLLHMRPKKLDPSLRSVKARITNESKQNEISI